MRKNSLMIKRSISFLVSVIISCVFCLHINSAGSKDISHPSYGGYRAYLEYYCDGSTTAGISRKTLVSVYLKASETLYMGSSVYESRIDENDVYQQNTVTGSDIVLIKPDGSKQSFDVQYQGLGHIRTVAQETAGPNISGTNTAGFLPLSYTADHTGVYQICFHSRTGQNSNPTPVPVTNQWSQSDSTVAAWNATVVDNNTGTIKEGRAFTKCLALNMGGTKVNNEYVSLNGDVYVVTSDGYIYDTKFDAVNPYGFVFFANNRGFVSLSDNSSLYKSYVSNDNNLSDLRDQGVTYHNPWNIDTDLDKTFNIFFERPDPELEGVLYPTAYEPITASNLTFVGSKGNNETHVGYGGYFKFDITNATSATVTLDLTNVLLPGGTYANYGTVRLSSPVTYGTNYFYWNGKGENGQIVPIGTYDNRSIKASVETHSGEYHFPLLDVEMAPNGFKVERINNIYREVTDASGHIYNLDVSDEYADGKDIIYYDNATSEQDTRYHNPAGIRAGTGGKIADSFNASAGVDSSLGAMKFSVDSKGNYLGDQTALDIWTYSNNNVHVSVELDVPIIIEDDLHTVLSGRVFYDSEYLDASATNNFFNLDKYDFTLPEIEVRLDYSYTDNLGIAHSDFETTVTDATGKYYFFGIPVMDNGNLTACTVTVTKPMESYTITTSATTTNNSLSTGTQIQSISLGGLDGNGGVIYSPEVEFSDVGYNYSRVSKNITVKKDWIIDISGDDFRPHSVSVSVASFYMDGNNNRVEADVHHYVLNNSNRWAIVLGDLPAYYNAAESEALEYEIINETYTMRGTGGLTYTYTKGDSPALFPYSTKFTSEDTRDSKILTAVNAPKQGTVQLVKRDVEETGLLLQGVEFVLWEETSLTEIPPGQEDNYSLIDGKIYIKVQTRTTNPNGVIVFPGLGFNKFFVVETIPRPGYILDPQYYEFAVSEEVPHLGETVYNTRSTSDITILKNIDYVMADTSVPITLEYADNASFQNSTSEQRIVQISSGKVSYNWGTVTVPSQNYVRVTEGNCSYVLNPSTSNVYDSTLSSVLLSSYNSGQSFLTEDGHNYTVTLDNKASFVETIHFQKLWLNPQGDIMDLSAYNTANAGRVQTSFLNDFTYSIQRTTDGATWSSVTKRGSPENVIKNIDVSFPGDPSTVGEFGVGTAKLIWTKRLSDLYWRLPKYDNSGNEYTYRMTEDQSANPGCTEYTGEITYTASVDGSGKPCTTASFLNPITSQITTYTAASSLGVFKSDAQQNFIIVNYFTNLYTMNVKKIDADTLGALPGAEFSLYSDSACTTLVSHAVASLNEDEEAVAIFENISPGTFYLKETYAPSGYALSNAVNTVVINQNGSVTVDGNNVQVTSNAFSITIEDRKGISIPQTGCGVSAFAVMALGIAICTLCLCGLLKHKKIRTDPF